MAEPFDDSRRLTGINPWLDGPGAALELAPGIGGDALLDAWRARVAQQRRALGWPDAPLVARAHAGGVSLALGAPDDQLYTATEVNEWAVLAALEQATPGAAQRVALHAPGHPAAWDEASARHTLDACAAEERRPRLQPLLDVARAQRVNALVGEDLLTLGSGKHGRSFPLDALPDAPEPAFRGVADVPIALVTGSNGKTTTVRLLAAILRAHGWRSAHTCTDGIFVDNEALEVGDWSGPSGARCALRRSDVDAAVLETARGGILRRGLAVQHADVAAVTNISNDHFGEYGVHTLTDLARVKLSVAKALGANGTLVANADDATLARDVAELPCALAWFALDDARPLLVAHRKRGGATCAVHDGRLRLHRDGVGHDLGAVADMPLSFAGQAHYNVANIAAASLAASALGIAATTIAKVLARFGAAHEDNPGRLQHGSIRGVEVFVDYAHNPEGLRALLEVAVKRRGDGRLGVAVGQAGNRDDQALAELAATVARYRPDRVVLKDLTEYRRGRAAGEVATVLGAALARHGIGGAAVTVCADELEATRLLLGWARAGDVLVLPTLTYAARRETTALLEASAPPSG